MLMPRYHGSKAKAAVVGANGTIRCVGALAVPLARQRCHSNGFDQERRGSRGGAGRGHQLCGRRRCLRDAVEQKSPPIGPEGFSRIAQALRRRAPDLPIVGIAAIDAGADGVAVISALSLADDPAAVARALRETVDGMLAKRGT